MRGTLHLVPKDSVGFIRKSYLSDKPPASFKYFEIDLKQAAKAKEKALKVLQKKGPQTSTTIKKHLPKEFTVGKLKKGADNRGAIGIIGHILRWAESLGEVEYGQVGSASWRKSDQKFSIPNGDYKSSEEHDADVLLAQWYLRSIVHQHYKILHGGVAGHNQGPPRHLEKCKTNLYKLISKVMFPLVKIQYSFYQKPFKKTLRKLMTKNPLPWLGFYPMRMLYSKHTNQQGIDFMVWRPIL